jgi:putative PEP-CTERM system TPR-repeat lipoprotein
LKNARINFEKALELQPDLLPAAYSLAILDLQEGNIQAARKRYDRMLEKNPTNEGVILATSELLSVSGGSAEQVRALIDKAIAANPSSVRARLALINFEARRQDAKATLAIVQTAANAIPNDPQLTQALGMAQVAAGEQNQAVETFKRLVSMQPNNPSPLVRLAETQVLIKDYPSAIDSARKALAVRPDFPQALAVLMKTYLVAGQPDAAMAEARRLQKEHPDKQVGYALEGDLLSAQKKWADAAAMYKTGVTRQPTGPLALRYFVALESSGKATEAKTIADKWIKDHPADTTFQLFFAQRNQQRKELSAAKAGYRTVLDIEPENPIALNNLAWLLAEDKDPKALEYAEEAHRLAPFNPNILDTLGYTLTRVGDPKRGIELLRMASRLAPRRPEIRLHLAKALAQTGDKAGARQEIGELTKMKKESPIRIEAEKLQETL